MTIGRRELLKLIMATAAGSAAWSASGKLVQALTVRENASPLLWLNPGGEQHNLLAMIGNEYPDFLRLIYQEWDLLDYDPLTPTNLEFQQRTLARAPILILEAIPPSLGEEPSPGKRISALLKQVKAVVLVGTDACFGGLRTREEDVTRLEELCKESRAPLIKLPGVPVSPHQLIGTLSHLEYFGFPRLDNLLRPLMYFGELVCVNCERRDDLEIGRFAASTWEEGCLLEVGCKGPITYNNCSVARWNGGENWCVGAGGPCTGCVEPGFPDHGGLGLAGSLKSSGVQNVSPLLRNMEIVGWGLLGTIAAGVGLSRFRAWLGPKLGEDEDLDSRRNGS